MSQKRHMLPLFSGLTLLLAFAVHWRSWRGLRPAWLCGSFSGWLKPGNQSLTHKEPEPGPEPELEPEPEPEPEPEREHGPHKRKRHLFHDEDPDDHGG